MEPEQLEYGDYAIAVTHTPPAWRAAIRPARSGLAACPPLFRAVLSDDREVAIAGAKSRIDALVWRNGPPCQA